MYNEFIRHQKDPENSEDIRKKSSFFPRLVVLSQPRKQAETKMKDEIEGKLLSDIFVLKSEPDTKHGSDLQHFSPSIRYSKSIEP